MTHEGGPVAYEAGDAIALEEGPVTYEGDAIALEEDPAEALLLTERGLGLTREAVWHVKTGLGLTRWSSRSPWDQKCD